MRWTLWLIHYMTGFVAVILQALYSKMRCIIWKVAHLHVLGVYLKVLSWAMSEIFATRQWSVLILMNFKWNLLSNIYFWSTHYLPNISQGKGYMKTYWLKGKRDLSFKTPAELRYSSEPKDSDDKSSNGWVDKRRAVSTKEPLFFYTQCGLRMPPVDSVRAVLIAPCSTRQQANWEAVLGASVYLKESCWPAKTKCSLRRGSCKRWVTEATQKQNGVRQNSTSKS